MLAGVSAFFLYRFRLEKTPRRMLKIMMYGGISAMVLGLFFGGYAGIPTDALPGPLRSLVVLNPLADPITVFVLALVFGVLQVIAGLVVNIISHKRNGQLKSGLLLSVPWIIAIVGVVLYAIEQTVASPISVGLYLALVGLLGVVLFKGHKEKTLFGKISTGVVGLYDGVGYFSDVLSYSRLMALGLATTALALAMNLIAQIVGDLIPVVGSVLAIILLIVGHVFNVLINTLGAFIHSARLQFVEFFAKFLTDSGREFRPFRRVRKFIFARE
jgi:V/A-type H+-transporting ATPase subunit I